MLVNVSDLCPSCRQISGLGGLTVEDTINTIISKKNQGINPPFNDDEANAMIYSCIYRYRNKDVTHPCLRLIADMVPSYMKGQR